MLAAACREAAHAVAGILLGVPFACAEIGAGGAAGMGRLVVEGKPDSATEEGMVCAMAEGGLRRPAPPEGVPRLRLRSLLPVRLLQGNLAARTRLFRLAGVRLALRRQAPAQATPSPLE